MRTFYNERGKTMHLQRFSLWILCLGLMASALAGCGGGGGGGGSSLPPMNTRITGFLTPPEVTVPTIAQSIRGLTGDNLLEKFALSGECTVNGRLTTFSLATSTKFFQITDIPPASFYEIVFTYQNMALRTIVPHEGPYMYNKSVNLESTAKALLINKYRDQGFDAAKLETVQIKQEYVNALGLKIQTWLTGGASNLEDFQNKLNAELNNTSANVSIDSLTTNLTPMVDLRGKWKGTNCVFYNLNLYGERAYKIVGDLSLNVTGQSGNSVTGTLAITVKSQARLPNVDLGVPEPSYPASVFTSGNISSTKFTFVYGNSAFEFQTLSDSMLGKVANRDLKTLAGLVSDDGAFLLTRVW